LLAASRTIFITRSSASRFVVEMARIWTSSLIREFGMARKLLRRFDVNACYSKFVASE